MLLRIRSKDGMFRIEVQPDTTGEEFREKIVATIPGSPDLSTVTLTNKPVGGEILPIEILTGRKVKDMGFGHGDMIYINYSALSESTIEQPPAASVPKSTYTAAPAQAMNGKIVEPATSSTNGTSSNASAGPSSEALTVPLVDLSKVKEDEVDDYWRGKDGKIERGRDAKMCRHGSKGMCDYCMPLEPYDSSYHATEQIKHLSYHAYLRKLQSSASASAASSSYLPPLTPLNYRVAIPCASGVHPSWPAGICSKCQPSAITLQSQAFRMVDHVEFSEGEIINRFLESWRKSGSQRFGLMIGRYQPYEKVPMGTKATVEAIHEIQQEGEIDGLTLGDDAIEEERTVKRNAEWCSKGLQVVGMIFTDVTADPDDKTKLLYKRHSQSFFLSSLETIFSAQQQLLHPNSTRSSPTGSFSSRFVTCCLTGSPDGGIEPVAYQVTEQAVAMVQADMIEASVDPGTVRVKKEDKTRYVPDVFYSYKNEYGIQVKNSAKPCLPVEYLLVNITHGFPATPSPLFRLGSFPIENRMHINSYQSLDKVFTELRTVYTAGSETEMTDLAKTRLAEVLSDWHMYNYIVDNAMLKGEEDQRLLGRATIAQSTSDEDAIDELIALDSWKTLLAIMDESPEPSAKPAVQSFGNDGFEDIPAHLLDEIQGVQGSRAASGGGVVACPHCTFENPRTATDCDVCGLPLG